jgi:hypothetical protein
MNEYQSLVKGAVVDLILTCAAVLILMLGVAFL